MNDKYTYSQKEVQAMINRERKACAKIAYSYWLSLPAVAEDPLDCKRIGAYIAIAIRLRGESAAKTAAEVTEDFNKAVEEFNTAADAAKE